MKVKVKSLSRVRLFATPRTVAHQSPLPVGFHRHEYWSGLPVPAPRDLPNPGIEPGSPALEADTSTSEPPGKPTSIPTNETGQTLAAVDFEGKYMWELGEVRV